MKYRKLRIAFSVACGALCLLLIALWVRSYSWYDMIFYRPTGSTVYEASAHEGVVLFADDSDDLARWDKPPSIGWTWYRNWPSYRVSGSALPLNTVFGTLRWTDQGLVIPAWLFMSAAIIAGAAPWLPRRFSLRTLLIAITLVAAALGAMIHAAR
jgi:hypothetical protein